MTLRLIVRIDDANMAVHAGGAVFTQHKTFDVDLPTVEQALRDGGFGETGYRICQLVGCEILERPTPTQNREDA